MPSARGSEPPARMPVSGSRAITCTEPPAPHMPARVDRVAHPLQLGDRLLAEAVFDCQAEGVAAL